MEMEGPTGLFDSSGMGICFKDRLRIAVDCNNELHGDWSIYEVRNRGTIPVVVYIKSEKGEILPSGSHCPCLIDFYDIELFLNIDNLYNLRPIDDLHVVGECQNYVVYGDILICHSCNSTCHISSAIDSWHRDDDGPICPSCDKTNEGVYE